MSDPNKYTWQDDDIQIDTPGDDSAEIIEFDSEDEDDEPAGKKALTTPDGEEVAYDAWAEYDTLKDDIGDVWLNQYQQQVLDLVLANVTDEGLSDADLDAAFDRSQDELIAAWTGTPDDPGVLSRLIMAGVAAGDASLRHHSAANPNRPMALKAAQKSAELGINWNLANTEAVEFIERYALNLIKRLDNTTRRELREVLAKWLKEGGTQAQLQQMIQEVILSEVRAQAISSTESTRAYSEGSRKRYKDAQVKKIEWRTVKVGVKRIVKRPGDVCKICSELDGKIGDIDKGVWSEVLQAYVFPPAHVGDRCWTVPADDEML